MQLELLANEHDTCGENPLWDDRRQLLFWVDIPAGLLRAYDPITGTYRLVKDLGKPCGAFTLQDNGDLFLLFHDESALLNPDTGELTPLHTGLTPDTGRFNDCIADSKGRVFAGTADFAKDKKGGIHRILPDGSCTELWRGTACSNGWGFTPAGNQLYFSDSTAAHIVRYPYDAATGDLGEPEVVISTPGDVPDGMTVDTDGNLWIAFWLSGTVRQYSPSYELIQEIKLPATHVTSCAFGGAEMNELYITSATGGDKDATPESGALYRLKVGVTGPVEYRSKIS